MLAGIVASARQSSTGTSTFPKERSSVTTPRPTAPSIMSPTAGLLWLRAIIRCSRIPSLWTSLRRNSLHSPQRRRSTEELFAFCFLKMQREEGALLAFTRLRGRRWLGCSNLAGANGVFKFLPVLGGLVRIVDTEADHGFIEPVAVAQIAINRAGIARARVPLGEQFAAHARVLHQAVAFEVVVRDARLVVAQLANQVVAASDGGPSQEDVGLHLHGAPTFGRALSLMRRDRAVGQIRRVGGFGLLLDLDEQRIVNRPPEHEQDVVTQAHAAGADHAEGDVLHLVLREEMGPFRQERLRVSAQRLNRVIGFFLRHVILCRLLLAKDMLATTQDSQLFKVARRRSALCLAKDRAHRIDFPVDLKTREVHEWHLGELEHPLAIAAHEGEHRIL